MREIKFRQRLKKQFWRGEERFHYWGYIDNSFVFPMGKNETDGDSEQFTGLKDHNGNDIYEGDIVTIVRNGTLNEEISVRLIGFDDARFNIGKGAIILSKSVKVTGNIHQKPEILEQN